MGGCGERKVEEDVKGESDGMGGVCGGGAGLGRDMGRREIRGK